MCVFILHCRCIIRLVFVMPLLCVICYNSLFFAILLKYFLERLKDPSAAVSNGTLNSTGMNDDRNALQAKFSNVMTLCAMVPLLIFTCLNSFIHQRYTRALLHLLSGQCLKKLFLGTSDIQMFLDSKLPDHFGCALHNDKKMYLAELFSNC